MSLCLLPQHCFVLFNLFIIGAFVIFPIVFMGFGMMGFGPMISAMWSGGMWGWGTMPGWLFVVGIVMQLPFLAVIIGGTYLVYRAVVGSESDADQAFEKLQFGYACGELTDEEYEQRREALERDTGTP